MAVLYGRAGRLTAQNGGFGPGQYAWMAGGQAPAEDAETAANAVQLGVAGLGEERTRVAAAYALGLAAAGAPTFC